MSKRVINSERAPRAVGPYSQAIAAGGFVFVSGQIPIDPDTGKLVESADVGDHVRRVMANLQAVLEAAGSGFERVVKATIYLANMADFPAVNRVYATYFGDAPPARATVQAGALPLAARVEIDVVALTA